MKKIVLIITSLFVVSCATTPIYQENGLPIVNSTPVKQSPAMINTGIRTFEMYKRSKKRVTNAQVLRVGKRIKNVVPLQSAQWEFVTFQNSTPNAFALPGGKVGIHTGILPIAQSDAGLATIVAHEIAHVARDHHTAKQKRQQMMGLATVLINSATGGENQRAIQTGAQLFFGLPNSRKAEIEADQVGLIYMARAGYDPREAIKFWERFAAYKKSKGQQSSPFLSTHPLDSTRIARLKEALPLALKEYQRR